MSRLIEADKLIDYYQHKGEYSLISDELIEDVNAQPTVDAVPTEFHDKCLQIEIQKRFNDAVYKDFAEWVAKWVVSENFQEEANAFAELACRRLVSLHVMEKKDGYYMISFTCGI